jgi:hypothetical protein
MFTVLIAEKNINYMSFFKKILASLFWVFLPFYLYADLPANITLSHAEKDPLNRYFVLSQKDAVVYVLGKGGIIKSGEGSSLLPFLRAPSGLQIQYPTSVWVLDRLDRTVIEFDMKLNVLGRFSIPSVIEEPVDFLILDDGRWIIADSFNEKIWQLIPGVQAPTSWGIGADLKIIPQDLRMIRLEGQSRRQVMLMSVVLSAVWIADSRGLILEKYVIPDSIKVDHPAGGDDVSCFVSGKSGTWRLSSTSPPRKIFDAPILRLWNDRAILKNGKIVAVDVKQSKPEGPYKR